MAILFSVLLVVLSACNKEKEYKPYSISEGVDICNICNMLVPDDRHATQIQLKDGQYFLFDDIGCHHEWLEKYGEKEIAAQYVRDFHTEEWFEIEKANLVYDKSFPTPMSYGIYTFKNKQEANTFVEEKGTGKIFGFDQFFEHHFERDVKEKQQN